MHAREAPRQRDAGLAVAATGIPREIAQRTCAASQSYNASG